MEDYAAFAMLARPVDPEALLGVVDATYSLTLNPAHFTKDG